MLVYKIKNKKTGEYLKDGMFDFCEIDMNKAINRHRKMKFEGKDNYNDFMVVEDSAADWQFVSFG
jgi:hypothetical protein